VVRRPGETRQRPRATPTRFRRHPVLDRLGEEKDTELIQLLALRLIVGQRPEDGGWDYGCPRLDQKTVPQLIKQLGDDKRSLRSMEEGRRERSAFQTDALDNSNTQFAILGPVGSSRHGVNIDKTIALVEKRFLSSQQAARRQGRGDGSWWYSPSDRTWRK